MSVLGHPAFAQPLDRDGLVRWYRANRQRSHELFAMIREDAYYDRPIALRNPIVFYEGHFPAFNLNTLVKLALGRPGIDESLERLFARGIDPEDEASVKNPTDLWPSRDEVLRFAAACDALVEEALLNAPLQDDRVPQLRGGEAVFTILEHELMHHETLLYMFHNLPYEKKVAPSSRPISVHPLGGPRGRVRIPSGLATLGQACGAFGWDNEFPQHVVSVEAFEIDAQNVSNGEYLEYVEATGAALPHFWVRSERGEIFWRGLFRSVPLPLDAPVYVTHVEASAYAQWKGGRLPSEAEFHRAAYGTPAGIEQDQLWGPALPDSSHGNFDFEQFEPVSCGSYAPSAWGVYDLVGNGWEWTSTTFSGFEGFEPMPSYRVYSADFFDGQHFVMKGASPVTARELVRRSFRNWFRPNYPFVYATFRVASSQGK